MRTTAIRTALILTVAATGLGPAFAGALGTAFTYQGRLDAGGNPANGVHDFRFKLFDAAAAGNQVGGTLNVADVNVVDGLFTVSLDFGSVFTGDARWLEIEVSPNNGIFTKLSPRQPLSGTPYALYSLAPWATSGTSIYYNGGNVGIGDSSPEALFTVGNGDDFQVNSTGDVFFKSVGASITFPEFTAGRDPQAMIYMFAGGTSNDPRMVLAHSPAYDTYGLRYRDVGDQFEFLGNGNNVMSILLGSRRVGIGTDSPKAALHVAGDYYGRGHVFLHAYEGDGNNGTAYVQARDDSGTSNIGLRFRTQNNGGIVDAMTLTKDGNVGIGLTTPGEPLTVFKDSGGTAAFIFSNTARCMSIAQYDSAATSEAVYMYSASHTAPALYVYNTSAPYALVVAGTAQVSVLEVTGADLAEKFPATETLAPGTVVMIDKLNPGKLCMARGAYNRCVAGIVSGANGLSAGTVLGNLPDSKDGPAIALSGRVWVRADAGSGAIEPGDLLTTSDTPGVAMKVADHARAQGAIIGKAMTELQAGTGMVLVLVNLQ